MTRIRWIASYALCGGAGSVVVLAAMRVGGGPVHGLHSVNLMTAVPRPAAAALELPVSVWLLARVGSGLVAFGHRPLSITWAGGWVSLPTSSLHPSPSERSARADQAAVTGATAGAASLPSSSEGRGGTGLGADVLAHMSAPNTFACYGVDHSSGDLAMTTFCIQVLAHVAMTWPTTTSSATNHDK